jgi:hypothetical protein
LEILFNFPVLIAEVIDFGGDNDFHASAFETTTTNLNMSSPTTVSGSCLCQSIQYTITGTDKGPVLCHCANCQKTTGSTFANNHRFTRAQITFTKGGDGIKAYKDSNTLTGNILTRWFCPGCGSPIYLENEKFKGLVILYSGCIEGQLQHAKPGGELFVHNKRNWFQGVEVATKL